MILVYHILTLMLFCVCLPLLPIVWVLSAKRRANLLLRLGVCIPIPEKADNTYRIWVHALSVGEVNASVPLVSALKERYPDHHIILTTSTRTGLEQACALMPPGLGDSPVAAAGCLPFDLWFAVKRVTSRISPDIVCLVETDLWPGFLSVMHQRRTPVILVNARLSQRSLTGYRRLGPLTGLFFSPLSAVLAQTRQDAAGFEQLGVPRSSVQVVGNIKFDRPCPRLSPEDRAALARSLGLQQNDRMILAGSTHPGEEIMVVNAFIQARQTTPQLRLVIAPRDPVRCSALRRTLPLKGFRIASYLEPVETRQGADILLIDTMGVLANAYACCTVAFVGGSLVPEGGHNLLEPAMFGKPVLFGPYMSDFQEMAGLFIQGEGGIQVADGSGLSHELVHLLADAARCRRIGGNAERIFSGNAGAIDRSIRRMAVFLEG